MLAMLAIFLFASVFAPHTSAADSANVKTDFGAVGDGATDDTAAIQAALSSDYSEIYFPEGEYKFTRQLGFSGKGNKTIAGEKATLFTDDDYSSSHAHDDAIGIYNVDGITFEGLHIEARQTENDKAFKTLVGVRYVTDIHFYDCEFSTVLNTAEPMLNGVDFWTSWHGVSIENSRFDIHADAENNGMTGSAVAFRNIQNDSSDNGKFINNVVYIHINSSIQQAFGPKLTMQ
jgi:hypothetical protein